VVFFDEFDSIGTKHGLYGGAKDDVVNTLLTEFDGLHGNDDVVVVIAATNMEALDPALLRPGRFEQLVEIVPPDESAQWQVFEVHTESLPLTSDVTAEWFVRQSDDPSGADVATIRSRARSQPSGGPMLRLAPTPSPSRGRTSGTPSQRSRSPRRSGRRRKIRECSSESISRVGTSVKHWKGVNQWSTCEATGYR
jgi:hypothetical protein